MTEPEEIKAAASQIRSMAAALLDLSNSVIRIRHMHDRMLTKTEKLDEAVALIRKAHDSLESAGIELMAANYCDCHGREAT